MSKMSELSALLDSLIECGQKLVDVGNGLKEYYSDTPKTISTPVKHDEAPVAEATEPAKTITFEEVRKVLAGKSSEEDGKYKAQVKALVAKYSDTGNLKGVPEDKYAALVAEAEVIGNA